MSSAVQDQTATPVRGEERVAGDYTIATAAGSASALVSFGSAMLTTRLLAPEAFGALSLVLVTSLVLQMATSSWTSLAVTRFGRELLDRGGTLSAITRARITIAGPWMLVAIAAILMLKAIGALPDQLTWALVGAAIAHGVVATAYEHCTNLMRSLGRQRLASAAALAQQLVIVAVLGFLLASDVHASPPGISLLYVAGTLGLLLLFIPSLWRTGLRPVPRDRELERRVWRFSTPLILFVVSSYVVGSIDLWVLGAFAPASAVGSYAAAYRAYAVLMTVASAASPVLMTLFVSLRLAGRSREISHFVLRTEPALMLVAGVAAALFIAPAYALAPVVFSHAFSSAALPLAILVAAVVPYLESCLVGTVLTSHDRTADAARAILAAAVLNVAGDLIAVGVFGAGIWAPAVATFASNFVMAAAYVRAVAAHTRVSARLSLHAYAPPVVAVLGLVLAPSGSRAGASAAAGAVASLATLAIGRRQLRQLLADYGGRNS